MIFRRDDNHGFGFGDRIQRAIFNVGDIDEESARAIRMLRLRHRCALVVLVIVTLVGGGWCAMNEIGERERREQLRVWAKSFCSDTSEALAAKFAACGDLGVTEAIPFAALTAVQNAHVDGKLQWHVVEARRFLRKYDIEFVLAQIGASLRERPENSQSFEVALRTALK